MVVYAKSPYAYVWGDNNQTHKQGKVFPEQALVVIRETNGWYVINNPVLDRPVDPLYPEFWIRVEDVFESVGDSEPPDVVVGEEISDREASDALFLLLKWLKQ